MVETADVPPENALADSAKEAVEEVKERVETVSREEMEAFLSQAVRLFLRGGVHLHLQGRGFPDVELKLTDDTLVVNLRELDKAVAWRLAAGPADVAPPEGTPEQVLDRWRVFVSIEDEPVAALGRGIPGVQVKTGKASLLLFKDFLKGLVQDKAALAREKEREWRRELLEKEIRYSRERTDAVVPELKPPLVEPGQEDLPGPGGRAHHG